MPVLGKRFHQGGGSSKEHSSVTALQTGVYGGIDPLTAANIGAITLPNVFKAQTSGSSTSTSTVEVVAITPPSNKFLYPRNIFGQCQQSGNATTGTVNIRITFSDSSTLDFSTGSVAGNTTQTTQLTWGANVFADNADAWSAVAAIQNLFTRLDQTGADTKKISRIALRYSTTAGGTGNLTLAVLGVIF